MESQFDLIVIGGGPAGYNAAEKAAHGGLKTLLIEKRALGGVCLNEGCVPTKTLLYSAKIFDSALHASDYGVSIPSASLNHAAVVARKDKVVGKLVGGVKGALKAAGVTVHTGEARVDGRAQNGYRVVSGEEAFVAERLLICSGSVAATPPIPGLKEGLASGFCLTNREILALTEVPKSLVVIGGGVIGLEMCLYFAVAGCQITVIEALDHIAGANDPDIIALLQKSLENRGVSFHLNSKVTAIQANAVVFSDANGQPCEVAADKVLVSIGRRAHTDGLGLESIGLATDRGAIPTDERMKTSVQNVYAAGDVNGKSMLAHTGYREGEVAVNNMLGIADRMRYDAIPAVVYTNPEIGAVGETLQSAEAKGIKARAIALPMQYSGRYVAENEKGNGICKLVFDTATARLIGAHVYANPASEFIVAAAEAIELGLTAKDLQKLVFPHPTVSEIFREAAFQW